MKLSTWKKLHDALSLVLVMSMLLPSVGVAQVTTVSSATPTSTVTPTGTPESTTTSTVQATSTATASVQQTATASTTAVTSTTAATGSTATATPSTATATTVPPTATSTAVPTATATATAQPATGGPTTQLLVTFKSGTSAADRDGAVRTAGGTSVREFGPIRTRVISVPVRAGRRGGCRAPRLRSAVLGSARGGHGEIREGRHT